MSWISEDEVKSTLGDEGGGGKDVDIFKVLWHLQVIPQAQVQRPRWEVVTLQEEM